jgi:hypothetical protein
MIDGKELKVILAHKSPVYDVPSDWQIVTTDPSESGFYVPDNSKIKQDNNHDVLSEFGYLIPLAKKIKTMPDIKTVRILQYRKVVSNQPLKEARVNNLAHTVLHRDIFKNYNLDQLTTTSQGILLSSVYNLKTINNASVLWKNILHNYSTVHFTEDILSFVVDAIRCEQLNNFDADFFLNYDKFLIGGIGLGVFPSEIFIKIMEKIENIVNYHYTHGWIKRQDSYDGHNMAFCIERLSSFLLLRELFDLKIDYKKVSGYTTIISEDGNYNPRNINHENISSIL